MSNWWGIGLVIVAATMGCAGPGARGLPDQLVERAYAEARGGRSVCRSGDADCCARQATAAREATASGQSARAAHLWHDLAVACPTRSEEARAMARAMTPSAPPGVDAAGAIVNVSYRVRLPADFRLYWVSASTGGRLLPVVRAMGPQPLDVEVQAIRFVRGRPGPLLAVERRLEVAFQPGAVVTIEIAEAAPGAPAPLAISAHVQPPPKPRTPGAPLPDARPRPAPRLEPARVVEMRHHRDPLELGSPLDPAAFPDRRVCLDAEGNLDTVRFFEAPHPRVAAALVDQLRDARHEPYRVNDLAVSTCMVVGRAERGRQTIVQH